MDRAMAENLFWPHWSICCDWVDCGKGTEREGKSEFSLVALSMKSAPSSLSLSLSLSLPLSPPCENKERWPRRGQAVSDGNMWCHWCADLSQSGSIFTTTFPHWIWLPLDFGSKLVDRILLFRRITLLASSSISMLWKTGLLYELSNCRPAPFSYLVTLYRLNHFSCEITRTLSLFQIIEYPLSLRWRRFDLGFRCHRIFPDTTQSNAEGHFLVSNSLGWLLFHQGVFDFDLQGGNISVFSRRDLLLCVFLDEKSLVRSPVTL